MEQIWMEFNQRVSCLYLKCDVFLLVDDFPVNSNGQIMNLAAWKSMLTSSEEFSMEVDLEYPEKLS